MTLSLSAITEGIAVVASDGAEFQYKEDGSKYIAEEHRQKLFQIPGRSIVLAAHGENRLTAIGGSLETRRLIGDLIDSLAKDLATIATVEEVALTLRNLLRADVKHTFELLKCEWSAYNTVLGICVIGFDEAGGNTRGFEVYWPWIDEQESPRVIPLFQNVPVTYAGLGSKYAEFVIQRFSDKFSPQKLWRASECQIQAYVRGVYQFAKKLQGQEACEFGGQYREVTVTQDGCKWTTPNWI